MRILKSFDTKIDAEEMLEAVEKYGEGNVILIKRHRIKLLTPLSLVFLSMIVEGILLYSIYMHLFDEHRIIFWILAVFYIYSSVTWCLYVIVGIIANIRWWAKAKKKYIESANMAVEKQKAFDKFLKRTFRTFVFHTLVLIFNATFPFIFIGTTGLGSWAVAIGILIIDIIFVLLVNRVMYHVIEYEMNFNICTQNSFTAYSQDGFFKTNTMDIATSAIKVIQHGNNGMKGAFFQFGDLYIHTDGDLKTKGGKTLELHYIPDPKHIAKKLNSIIERVRQSS